MFQQTVGRNFTTGFPGDIVRDGPQRAKPARIVSDNTGLSQNVISRAFGFKSDQSLPVVNGVTTQTLGAFNYEVGVGGANFYGVLGHPKHYVLKGTAAGGPLAATITLPRYTEGEFFDMVTGMVVELFNHTTGTVNVAFGWELFYVLDTADGTANPNNIPFGGIIALAPGSATPTGFGKIPNGRVINPVSLAASSPTAQVSTYTIVQLTQ